MSIETFPQTSDSAAAAAVVDRPASGDVQRIEITSRRQWLGLRKQDVTASAAACLFGLPDDESEQTPLRLYMLKTGAIEEESDAPKINGDQIEFSPMGRGSFLEDKAAEALHLLKPHWTVQKCPYYYRDPVARLGATPDLLVHDPERGFGTVQIKNPERSVYHSDKWKSDGEFEAPLAYAIQTSVEAHLTDARWAAVGAFVVGHKTIFRLFDIPIKPALVVRTRELVADFWRRVRENDAYDPDFGRDGELISRIFDDPAPGVIADLTSDNHLPEIAAEDEILAEEIKAKTARRKEIKKEFEFKIGNCAGAIFRGGSVTKKIVHKKAYSVPASSYPDIRIKRS
jgi:hypothetical protein